MCRHAARYRAQASTTPLRVSSASTGKRARCLWPPVSFCDGYRIHQDEMRLLWLLEEQVNGPLEGQGKLEQPSGTRIANPVCVWRNLHDLDTGICNEHESRQARWLALRILLSLRLTASPATQTPCDNQDTEPPRNAPPACRELRWSWQVGRSPSLASRLSIFLCLSAAFDL